MIRRTIESEGMYIIMTKSTKSKRNKGEGSICLDRGRYRAFLNLGVINGKRKRVSVIGDTVAEVVKKLELLKTENARGTLVVNSGTPLRLCG